MFDATTGMTNRNNITYMTVQGNVSDCSSSVVQVHGKLVKRQFFLQVLTQVPLNEVLADSLFQVFGPNVPHLADVYRLVGFFKIRIYFLTNLYPKIRSL